jgi:hypothetical protein
VSNGPIFNIDRIEFHGEDRLKRALMIAQFHLDQQVIKDSNYFIPKDTGNLEGSALLSSNIGKGRIFWNTPYARKLYYNPQYNFSHDKNPNAKGLWFEEAKAIHLPEWTRMVKAQF